jgi:hypothetical protein
MHAAGREAAMLTNETPTFDLSDNETRCCPRFRPEPWDRRELHFVEKPFVKASTVCFFHIPLNMGGVFGKTYTTCPRCAKHYGNNYVVGVAQVS